MSEKNNIDFLGVTIKYRWSGGISVLRSLCGRRNSLVCPWTYICSTVQTLHGEGGVVPSHHRPCTLSGRWYVWSGKGSEVTSLRDVGEETVGRPATRCVSPLCSRELESAIRKIFTCSYIIRGFTVSMCSQEYPGTSVSLSSVSVNFLRGGLSLLTRMPSRPRPRFTCRVCDTRVHTPCGP